MEITILDTEEDDYQCENCGRKFKGTGKRPLCPDCQSDKVNPL
ncbi:MAG: hypothetical protein QMD46_08480 [Methanomicrobiales archaeon]|nr:hypothetical protein [Methanomicrobiales archaeon]MDI6876282.1 hypothetical protein [Methanomicrobiales archaeon]